MKVAMVGSGLIGQRCFALDVTDMGDLIGRIVIFLGDSKTE